MKKMTLTIVVVFLLANLALASTIDTPLNDEQPPWWRGQWSTTYQYWHFLTPDPGDPASYPEDGGVAPDGPGPLVEGSPGQPYDPGYLPSTMLWVYPEGDWIESDGPSNRVGIWPLSGHIDVIVDNHDPENEFKDVWLQVVWRAQEAGAEPIIGNLDPPAHPDYEPRLVAPPVDLGSGWFENTYEWRIYPNPEAEMFTISGTIDVDQLIIDTWCVPEPATLLVLALGLIPALLKRRRKV